MATERQAPDAQLSCVNLVTCDVTEHDADPDSDSTTIAATANNVNTEYGVDFPTPTGDPTVGTDLQEFKVGVEEFDSGQTGTPTARIELWENGSLVRAGTDTNVGAFAVLSFKWNANELATADGSLVQCKLIGTGVGGAPTARNSVNIGQMEWNVDYVSSTTTFKTLAITATGVVTFSSVFTAVRSAAITATGVVSMSRLIKFTKAITAIGNVTMARTISFTRALTATGAVVFSKGLLYTYSAAITAIGVVVATQGLILAKALSATAIGVAGLSRLSTYAQALSATAVGVVSLTRWMRFAKAITAGTIAVMTKVATVVGATAVTIVYKTLNIYRDKNVYRSQDSPDATETHYIDS